MIAGHVQDRLIEEMNHWQRMEREAITHAGGAVAKTEHAVIRLMMEIVQQDSEMHQRLQGLVVRHRLFEEPLPPPGESLGELKSMVVKSRQAVKRMIEIMDNVFTLVNGEKASLLKALLQYLRSDERKHFLLLQDLENLLEKK